jgi:hypothetical protein
MLRARRELGLRPGVRGNKKDIQHWLADHWPPELGERTDKKTDVMATFLRDPAFEKGGRYSKEQAAARRKG